MSAVVVSEVLSCIEQRQPQYFQGVLEARKLDPERFDRLAEMFLGWANRAQVTPPFSIEKVIDSYAEFTLSVNLCQVMYERTKAYSCETSEQSYAELYGDDEEMETYVLGVMATLFLWPHHLEIAAFFEDRFLKKIAPGSALIELAPGHGGWGLWALTGTQNTSLVGIDISPTSVRISTLMAEAAGLEKRASYKVGDALTLDPNLAEKFDYAISGFVVEHLQEPQRLFDSLAGDLKVGGTLFLTGALTAAQVDHIAEFKRESELVLMAEKAGFRVLELFSGAPSRTLPGANFLPRSMAMILQKRRNDTW